MPTKPLDRLMFAQGGQCFFCKQPLPRAEASVEHLVASANGGSNKDENCVVCCKSFNALLGSMSLKEKIQVVLNQKGDFKCPNSPENVSADESTAGTEKSSAAVVAVMAPAALLVPSVASEKPQVKSIVSYTPTQIAQTIANLQQRGTSRPRTVKTLTSTVSSIFNKKLPESEIESMLKHLQARGVVKYNGTKVSYAFPSIDA